ncbi:antitoxin Xre/MbcA/ParS toxin-binding domain-containing protein [Ectopseudomonas mendocina]|uniref:antitoxin Xre/MbcA/ParS toxin-binding domain-containing protein n=1 Tax=Ectopseudomonas mendocina TaxID=300 RepID=UPI000E1C3530
MPVGALHRRLGLPTTHYRMHHAALDGLPTKLAADLAHELGLPCSQIAKWIGASPRRTVMSPRSSEVLYHLVEVLDALLELSDGNLDGALRWLTSPNRTLASERPLDLLVTEPGCRAVLQVIRSIEHGLPV